MSILTSKQDDPEYDENVAEFEDEEYLLVNIYSCSSRHAQLTPFLGYPSR